MQAPYIQSGTLRVHPDDSDLHVLGVDLRYLLERNLEGLRGATSCGLRWTIRIVNSNIKLGKERCDEVVDLNLTETLYAYRTAISCIRKIGADRE